MSARSTARSSTSASGSAANSARASSSTPSGASSSRASTSAAAAAAAKQQSFATAGIAAPASAGGAASAPAASAAPPHIVLGLNSASVVHPVGASASSIHSFFSNSATSGEPDFYDTTLFAPERKKIRAAFDLFDKDKKKAVVKEEIGTIMRYLGAYPTEEELINDILPRLIASSQGGNGTAHHAGEEDDDDAGSALSPRNSLSFLSPHAQVTLAAFEPFMLSVMFHRLYEPDTEEVILQAFRVLDPEGRGYIDEQTLTELLQSNEWAFRDKEMEDFLRIAKDPDTGFVHYEDYVGLLNN